MDVINLYKFGIQNVVANLGTAMTERQIDLIWSFFKNPIICLDGDVSGRKAALRAAERLFPLMKPDYNIYFLTLPENLDPDAYINQKGKESFIKLTESKVEIQSFVWNSYYQDVDKNNPHSLTLFEKKIKALCAEVKDKTLAKYFLDSFIQKINELTPNLNFIKLFFLKFKLGVSSFIFCIKLSRKYLANVLSFTSAQSALIFFSNNVRECGLFLSTS
jgi:DNA primase